MDGSGEREPLGQAIEDDRACVGLELEMIFGDARDEEFIDAGDREEADSAAGGRGQFRLLQMESSEPRTSMMAMAADAVWARDGGMVESV